MISFKDDGLWCYESHFMGFKNNCKYFYLFLTIKTISPIMFLIKGQTYLFSGKYVC